MKWDIVTHYLSSFHPQKEKEMMKLFQIKVQNKAYSMFDSSSQVNLIAKDLVSKLGVNKDVV